MMQANSIPSSALDGDMDEIMRTCLESWFASFKSLDGVVLLAQDLPRDTLC